MKRKADGRKRDIEKYGVRRITTRDVIAYPWSRWLKKAQLILRRGVDYGLESKKFAQQIRNTANERGLDVSIKVRPHAVAVTVWNLVKGKV